MSERCPLENGTMHWDNESLFTIPDVCTTQCGDIWDAATQEKPDDLDTFDPECKHFTEYGGTSLYRSEGALRSVGILQLCMKTGEEAFAETWSFTCPFEDVN